MYNTEFRCQFPHSRGISVAEQGIFTAFCCSLLPGCN